MSDPDEQTYLDLVDEIDVAISDCHETQEVIDDLQEQLDTYNEGGE